MVRPSAAGLLSGLVVLAFGLVLAGIGLPGLLRSHDLLDLLLLAVAGYALWQSAQTPIALRLAGGRVTLVGLYPRSLARADLARVELAQGGYRRLWRYRFRRRDGTVAFETDATLWRQAELEKLLGLKVERS